MRNVDWIVLAPTVAYVLLVAFALWVETRALRRESKRSVQARCFRFADA
jgi:hypothetical protein